MSQAYICQEYMGVESPWSADGEGHPDSEDEFAPPLETPPKKMKSSGSMFSTFTEEDLSYFVQRVSMENQDKMRSFLRAENGQMSAIIYKMLESRLTAQNAKLNKMLKSIDNRFSELEKLSADVDAKISKLEGMGKFTYAWCKSAQEAGVYKMKQKY
jgi:hypothetical protein